MMAISVLQTATGATSGYNRTLIVSLGSGSTAGSVLVMIASTVTKDGVSETCTDDKGNTWTRAVFAGVSGRCSIDIWVCSAPAAGTVAVTHYNPYSTKDGILYEIAGLNQVSTIDKTSTVELGTYGYRPSITVPAVTTTGASEFIIGAIYDSGNSGASSADGFSLIEIAGISAGSKIVSSTGSYAFTLSWSTVNYGYHCGALVTLFGIVAAGGLSMAVVNYYRRMMAA